MAEVFYLPREERAKFYRVLAQDCRLKATQHSGALQASFIDFAGQWEKLAQDVERGV